MDIRTAATEDADQMSDLLQQLVEAGKRTSPADRDFVLRNYVEDPDRILCSVAVDGGEILGFQSLKQAVPGNRFNTPVGWGIIGTHVSPRAARRGVGSKLFQASRSAAESAGLETIEAFIGATNVEGQAYYEAMGFETYRLAEGAVCKCFRLRATAESEPADNVRRDL